jgi:tetratricopeptide (TPR) repeat protein
VLLAAVREAAATGQDWYAWQLAWAIATYLDRRGLWWELAATQETALAAARRLGDRLGETEATRLLGLACLRLGRYAEAEIHLNASRDLALALDDPARQGHCRMNLAQVSARQGDHVDALSHAQQAHSSFKVAGHRYGQANALNAIGWYHTQLHEYREALVFGAQALPLLQEIGDVHGQAAAWDTLGYAHQRLGDVVLAVTHYQRAVELYEEVGDRFFAADSLVHLGDAHGAAGDRADACRAWRGALAVLDELGHPSAEAVRKRLAGDG